MGSILPFYLTFLLFWTSTNPDPSTFSTYREVYVFSDTHGPRFFDLLFQPSKKERPSLILERRFLNGPHRAGLRSRRIFKFFFADLDADGQKELVLGVVKTVNGRDYRRVYLYSIVSTMVVPKWLGSRLSFLLNDFEVLPYKQWQAIRARETHFGKRYLSWYLWDRFGFRTISMKEIFSHE